jgi:hypothetical protein
MYVQASFARRPLAEPYPYPYPYLILDARYEKVREDGVAMKRVRHQFDCPRADEQLARIGGVGKHSDSRSAS